MTEFVSGIKPITPTIPLRPVQPAQKDRQPGGRKKKQTGNNGADDSKDRASHDSDSGDKPTIDEHV